MEPWASVRLTRGGEEPHMGGRECSCSHLASTMNVQDMDKNNGEAKTSILSDSGHKVMFKSFRDKVFSRTAI